MAVRLLLARGGSPRQGENDQQRKQRHPGKVGSPTREQQQRPADEGAGSLERRERASQRSTQCDGDRRES
jgi:hypothetical protein